MKKEDVAVVAQLLTAIKNELEKLEKVQRKGDKEELAMIKQEILDFQRKIDKLL